MTRRTSTTPRTVRAAAAIGVTGALLVALAPGSPVVAAPPTPAESVDVQGERKGQRDADRRPAAAPTERQQAAARRAQVRFNRLGTPAAVLREDGAPLVTGLPADPERAARAYLASQSDLFGLSAAQVDGLERVVVQEIGRGAAVVLRQVFGELRTASDGLVSVGVVDGTVVHVTSSLTRGTALPQPARLTAEEAERVARADGSFDADAEAVVELVALPVAEGARSAYQVVLQDAAHGHGATTYVDAVSAEVLLVEDLVDHAADDPSWAVFPANPPADYSSTDDRVTWCAEGTAPGCGEVVRDAATGRAWDERADGTSTSTTEGNSARTGETRAASSSRAVATRTYRTDPTRTYGSTWTNQWYEQGCDPATLDSLQEADLEAAMANLFAMHNRMHDWTYGLGFTEQTWNLQDDNAGRGGRGADAEQGNAQAGARIASIRDNANQFTPPDGQKPITNMYMWQPIAAAFYAPCVDGDYDMSVIGHEYGHAVSNRMVAGPDRGLSGPQAGAMGESWSDLMATEYLREHGYRSSGVTPYVVGGYVTGDQVTGIRNYDMSRSPLNYSDVGYDLTGPQVHADGEIWSATNHALREAMQARYPSSAAGDEACAKGTGTYETCGGGRRWMQLVFDSYLLMAQGAVSMVDAKDALLAADLLRGGADQELLRRVFASRGLGLGSTSAGTVDADPVPSFRTGSSDDAAVRFTTAGDDGPVRVYIGTHEARALPVADTDPATTLADRVVMTPGTYQGLAVGATTGHQRFTFTVTAGAPRTVPVQVSRNLSALANGATVTATTGVNADELIDGTEGTNWASRDAAPVAGRGVTVDLAGTTAQVVRRVQVSAALRPLVSGDADSGSQNRYTALRSFRLLACDATSGADCASPASFQPVYSSPADAFPADRPRPTVVDLQLRSFDVPQFRATHVRFEAVDSQCTGAPAYQGEQDQDPRSSTDCDTSSTSGDDVRAAELQVFAQ